MGWLWSSNRSSAPPKEANSSPEFPSEPSALPPQPSSTIPSPSKPLTRDELAEQELQSFLSEIEIAEPTKDNKKYRRLPSSTSATSNSPNPAPLSLADSLLPTTLSCRDAFDSAFFCQSFGGQFNNLYRHGEVRDCSDHWSDFWFCMKTRSYSDEAKQDMIRDRWRKREYRKYNREVGGRSSEDVWRAREEKVPEGTAFRTPLPEMEIVGGGGDKRASQWKSEE